MKVQLRMYELKSGRKKASEQCEARAQFLNII